MENQCQQYALMLHFCFQQCWANSNITMYNRFLLKELSKVVWKFLIIIMHRNRNKIRTMFSVIFTVLFDMELHEAVAGLVQAKAYSTLNTQRSCEAWGALLASKLLVTVSGPVSDVVISNISNWSDSCFLPLSSCRTFFEQRSATSLLATLACFS